MYGGDEGAQVSSGSGTLPEVAEQILASDSFRRSPRLKELLRFLVKCSTEGREHELNEYSIGVQVFGKPKSYTPSQDNIVRVTARQMRIKLAEYYAGEGKKEHWRLDVPRGGYVPELVAAVTAESGPAPRARMPGWAVWVMSGLALLACAGLGVIGWQFLPEREQAAGVSRHLLEGMIGDGRTVTTIVLDDPLLPRLWGITGRHISLEDLLENRYLNKGNSTGIGGEETRQMVGEIKVTSAETMRLVGHMYRVAGGAGRQVYVRHCRNMQARELERGNLIFLGGVGANPWVYLIQRNLNFEHVIRPRVSRVFINRKPKAGEPAEYTVMEGDPKNTDRYARIAVLKNPLGSGRVALMGGTSKESSEAAGEFALSSAAQEQVKRLCGVGNLTDLDSFELILKSSTVGGESLSTHIVAHRCNGQ